MATAPASSYSNSNPLPVILTATSQQGLLDYLKACDDLAFNMWNFRERLEYIDKEYYRENAHQTSDLVAGQAANKAGNKKKLADIVVPIVEPQIETGLAYLASVFLTGHPIFGCVADAANIDQAKAMEAIIEDQSVHGGWVRELMLFLRDGLKYDINAVEVSWLFEKTYQPYTNSTPRGNNVEQREIIWQGNAITRIDPYNLCCDYRVTPAEMHKKAEFAGYVKLMGRIALKEYLQALPSRMNVKEAFESGLGGTTRYYIPSINWDGGASLRAFGATMDWTAWATNGANNSDRINYKNLYEVSVKYCRIIPSDFNINVPAKNTPQIWKFVVVNNQVIVHAEKQTNAHNYLPILFGQPIEDGLGFQTKSPAARLIPIQDTASTLWNLRLAAKRRSISDRGLYNPALVRQADINSDNPSAKIPVRPAGYGKSLNEAYYPIPYEDRDSSSFTSDAREMMQFGNFISGQNPAQQGQFVKGNKTLQEFQDVMQSSSGRQQMMAYFLESQIFVPMKEIIKLNILQYIPAGKVFSVTNQQYAEVDPVKLRQSALAFKMPDGLVPAEKIMNEQGLQASFQFIAQLPQLQMAYDLPSLFTYLMKTQNVDLTPFQKTPVTAAPPPPTGGSQGQSSPQQAGQDAGAAVAQQASQTPNTAQGA